MMTAAWWALQGTMKQTAGYRRRYRETQSKLPQPACASTLKRIPPRDLTCRDLRLN
jgi:hypothetical protein